jgi:dCMP deaminase
VPRISRHQLFMGLAETFAMRGTCPRAQVGAVVVRDRHVISHGYNGAPAGLPHCLNVGCGGGVIPPGLTEGKYTTDHMDEHEIPKEFPNGCTRAVHAEANAIAYAASQGVSVADGVMYCTCEPCRVCAQLIVTAEIMEVIYKEPYRIHDGLELLREAGIRVVQYAEIVRQGDFDPALIRPPIGETTVRITGAGQ